MIEINFTKELTSLNGFPWMSKNCNLDKGERSSGKAVNWLSLRSKLTTFG